jgi:hypothetical protein
MLLRMLLLVVVVVLAVILLARLGILVLREMFPTDDEDTSRTSSK